MRAKKIPMRRCVGCREKKEKRGLLRIVRDNMGEIFVDPTGKKNGRGAYICRDMDCFTQARKVRALNQEFSCEIPEEVYEEIQKQLEEYVGK
ncbi:MAG: YlxR family protein [Clostridiaceae bacterium]|nr:YlxR family protein [Clostridiaceae bacterium]